MLLYSQHLEHSYSQMIEYVNNEMNFSLNFPSDWQIFHNLDAAINSNPSSLSINGGFPQFGQDTSLTLNLKDVSEMDLDQYSYITVSVKDLKKSSNLNNKS